MDDLGADILANNIAKHAQSNRRFDLSEPLGFSCNIQERPGGGGRSIFRNRTTIDVPAWLKKKKSVFSPNVPAGLCLPAALALSLEFVANGAQAVTKLRKSPPKQIKIANGYLAEAGAAPGTLDFQHVRLLVENVGALRGYAISVFDVTGKRVYKYVGGTIGELFLLLHGDHYYA